MGKKIVNSNRILVAIAIAALIIAYIPYRYEINNFFSKEVWNFLILYKSIIIPSLSVIVLGIIIWLVIKLSIIKWIRTKLTQLLYRNKFLSILSEIKLIGGDVPESRLLKNYKVAFDEKLNLDFKKKIAFLKSQSYIKSEISTRPGNGLDF